MSKKSPHIKNLVVQYYQNIQKQPHVEYADIEAYCDFVVAYIMAGGKFNDFSPLYMNINGIYALKTKDDFAKADQTLYRWDNIYIGLPGHELSEEFARRAEKYAFRICDFENPVRTSRYAEPKVNDLILKEIKLRGVKMPWHRISDYDDFERLGRVAACLSPTDTTEEMDQLAQEVSDDIIHNLPIQLVVDIFNKTDTSKSNSYVSAKLMKNLRPLVEEAQSAQSEIKNWKPIKF